MSTSAAELSVLIGSKDRPGALIRCLRSVLGQKYEPFEILVLDDNSNENLSDAIAQELTDERLKCIRSEKTLGVAGGRNELIKKAQGRYLITLDDDAILRDDDCIEKLISLFDSHPDVGLLSFKIVDVVGGKETRARVPYRRATIKRHPEVLNSPQYASYFLGGGHAARKSVYDKCGLYQEDLLFGCEELDMSYRILEAGYKIFYTPDIVVEHYPETPKPSTKAARRKYSYYLMRNKIWINYKYLPWFACIVNTVLWSLTRLALACRDGGFFQVLRGIKDGFKELRRLKRTPVSSKTVAYLRQNHGRIFF